MPIGFPVESRPSATAEEEAYRHIQRSLRLGRYKPGERLIPEDIAAEIGMSRMPVREAFRRLASEGLVVLRPNRGCIVAGLTLDELNEIFEIRSVLEGLAVRLAVPRINEEEIDELQRLLDRMESAGKGGGSDWVILHQEFHRRICALSQRPKLIHQISALHVVIEPYMRIWFDYIEKPLSAREEHAAVIAALRSGDASHAEQVMQDHINGTAPMLAEFVTSCR
jgi:DNA-binding GntR family transcriptional regulator